MTHFDDLIAERIEMLRAITGEVEVWSDSISAMRPAYIVMHLEIVVELTKAGITLNDAFTMCPVVLDFAVLDSHSKNRSIDYLGAAADLAAIVHAFNITPSAVGDTVLEIREFGVDMAEPLKLLGTVANIYGWTIRQTLAAFSAIPAHPAFSIDAHDRASLLRQILLAAMSPTSTDADAGVES